MPKPSAVNLSDKLLTIDEVAHYLRIERHHVTRMFERERGVRIFNNKVTRNCRPYRQFRIPQSVLNRVCERVTVKEVTQ